MFLRLATILTPIALFQFCGSKGSFSGEASKTPTKAAEPKSQDVSGKLIDSITWNWNCQAASSLSVESQNIALTNEGPHVLKRNMLATQVNIHVLGQACAPQRIKRDVVFVLDVSGSMSDRDPLVNGSCNRLKAFEQSLKAIGEDSSNQFAVVTFDERVETTSTSLQKNIGAVYSDLKTNNPADVLCKISGGTNYEEALLQSQKLLNSGAQDSLKQIVFVSDGEPTPGKEGASVALALKKNGISISGKITPAVIATLMLGGDNDTVLKNQIASLDNAGSPLHRKVDDASGLAAAMTILSQNIITLISLDFSNALKSLANSYPTTMDDKSAFDAKGFTLVLDSGASVLSLKVKTIDRLGVEQVKTGLIQVD